MIGGYIDVTYLPYMLSSTDPKVFPYETYTKVFSTVTQLEHVPWSKELMDHEKDRSVKLALSLDGVVGWSQWLTGGVTGVYADPNFGSGFRCRLHTSMLAVSWEKVKDPRVPPDPKFFAAELFF